MVDQRRLQAALNEFARTLISAYEIGQVLYRLSDHVTQVVSADGCGVSIMDRDGELRFVTATNAVVERIERIQEEGGHGPCVTSASQGTVVAVTDLGEDHFRWPEFADAALQNNLRAVLAIPMLATDHAVGALTIYRFDAYKWEREEIEAATTLSAMATAYTLLAGRIESSQQRAEQLQHALDSRVVIEQAKGMLAVQNDESLDQAFARVRQYARDHNVSVHQVARELVEERLRL